MVLYAFNALKILRFNFFFFNFGVNINLKHWAL